MQQTPRAVIYARYSSDLQREASIEDQLEVCRRYAEAQGWTVVGSYTDAALSGASRFRPGFQKLTADAGQRRFDVVICEAVDRLGRRLADTADLQDTLAFHKRAPVHAVAGRGDADPCRRDGHDGADVAEGSGREDQARPAGAGAEGACGGRAGLWLSRSRAEHGRRAAPAPSSRTRPRIVERIFREFAAGKSPEATARDLNREGVPGRAAGPGRTPRSGARLDRGTGVLNNSLYRGVLEWNRCSYVKDPRTGKRVARPNPPELWEVKAVPELRIVDDELWAKVKARQRWCAPPPTMPVRHRDRRRRAGPAANA